jgi:hypothetical protein
MLEHRHRDGRRVLPDLSGSASRVRHGPADRRRLGLDQRASDVDVEIGRQAAEFRDEVARAPKRVQAACPVGRRKRWYEVPDESIT